MFFIKRGVTGKHQDKEDNWLSLCHVLISREPLPGWLVMVHLVPGTLGLVKNRPHLQPNVSMMCSVTDCVAKTRGFAVPHTGQECKSKTETSHGDTHLGMKGSETLCLSELAFKILHVSGHFVHGTEGQRNSGSTKASLAHFTLRYAV